MLFKRCIDFGKKEIWNSTIERISEFRKLKHSCGKDVFKQHGHLKVTNIVEHFAVTFKVYKKSKS